MLLYPWDFPIKNIGGCASPPGELSDPGIKPAGRFFTTGAIQGSSGYLDQSLFESGEMMARVSGGGEGESHGIPQILVNSNGKNSLLRFEIALKSRPSVPFLWESRFPGDKE